MAEPDALTKALQDKYQQQTGTQPGGITPGSYTAEGTFIPDIGQVWEDQDRDQPTPESAQQRLGTRRDAVSRGLDEVIESEQMMRTYGQEVPPVDREEEHGFWRYPLAMLSQLQRGQFAVVGGLEGVLEKDPAQALQNFYRGLIFAEPHETADLLERYEVLQNNPWANFGVSLVGDIALDPLTWVTFGGSAVAKGALTAGFKAAAKRAPRAATKLPWNMTKRELKSLSKHLSDFSEDTGRRMLTADEIRPHLSRFGKDTLDEALSTVPEEIAVNAIITEVAAGSKVGRKLTPSGARFVHMIPRIGGQSIADVAKGGLEKLGVKTGYDLIPGGVVQRVDDLEASQSLFDKFTRAMAGTPVGKGISTFGQAFIPYWNLRRDYPGLVELDRAFKAGAHDKVDEIVRRAREIVKLVEDPEERKLLTELVEKPWLLSGKKFADVVKTGKREVTINFNQDYFPEGERISESHAEQVVDGIYALLHKSRDPAEFRLGTPGAYGQVVGGPAADVTRFVEPYLQNIIEAHPNVDWLNVRFQDWVIKVPKLDLHRPLTRVTRRVNEVGLTEVIRNPEYHGMIGAVFENAASEAYVMRAMGDNPAIAGGRVVWRKMSEIYKRPETGANLSQYDDLMQRTVYEAGKTAQQLDAHEQWAWFVGGWEHYQKTVPLKARKYKTLKEYIDATKNKQPTFGELRIPIVVKRYVDGPTATEYLERLDTTHGRIRSIIDTDSLIDDYSRFIASIDQSIQSIARSGIRAGDMHGQNFIMRLDEEGRVGSSAWIDYGLFDDYAQGVGTEYGTVVGPLRGSGGIVSGIPTQQQAFKTTKVRGVKVRADDMVSRVEHDVPLPGAPGFEARHPKIRHVAKATGGPAGDYAKRMGRHLKNAQSKALQTMQRHLVRAPASPTFRAMSEFTGKVARSALGGNEKREAIVKFLSKLKRDGIVKSYSIGDTAVWPPGMTADVTSSHAVGNQFNYHVAWMNDVERMVKPIHVTQKKFVTRTWEEVGEILVDKHPDFLKLPKDRQAAILKAHGLASDWLSEMEQMLLQRNILDPGKVDAFKRKYGLELVPEIKNIKTPHGLFRALNRAMKDRVNLGSIKTGDMDAVIRDVRKEFNRDLLEGDIAKILMTHAIDTMAATDSFDMVAEIAKLYGKPAPLKMIRRLTGKGKNQVIEEVAEHVADAGMEVIAHPALKGLQVPTEVARYLKQFNKTFFGDGATQKIFNGYHRVLGVWKGYATFVNPGFHGRNFFSNIFQLYLKDGPEAMNVARHKQVVDMMMGKDVVWDLADGSKVGSEQMMKWARRYGIYGHGWFMSEIGGADDVTQFLSRKTSWWNKVLGTENPVMQAGRRVGGAVENEARLVGFVNDVIRMGNPQAAASNTKKYLFDYAELTEFERNVMKGIFPFYTWMRKNVELQVSQIMQQPGKYGNIERVKSNLERQSPDVDERWLPKYFPELYATRLPITTDKGNPVYLNPNLPFQDLNRIFDPGDWMSSLAPWKVMAERYLNKEFFTNKPIERYKGELAQVEWLDTIHEMNPRLGKQIADVLHAKQIYEPETGGWHWGLRRKLRFTIEQLNPFLRNIREVTGFFGGEVPYYRQERRPYDVLSRITGVKMIPYNQTKEMENYIFERRDQLRDLKKSLQQQGKIPSQLFDPAELPPRM